MPSDDPERLQRLYRRLRAALEAAYAARPWNGPRIDRIARDLLRVERALAAEARAAPRGRSEIGATPISLPDASDRRVPRARG